MVSACSHGSIMTRNDFDNVQQGTPVSDVIQEYGQPVKTTDYCDGTEGYLYIERLPIGEQTVVENSYYIVVKDGKVVGKRFNAEEPYAFDEIYEEDPNAVEN